MADDTPLLGMKLVTDGSGLSEPIAPSWRMGCGVLARRGAICEKSRDDPERVWTKMEQILDPSIQYFEIDSDSRWRMRTPAGSGGGAIESVRLLLGCAGAWGRSADQELLKVLGTLSGGPMEVLGVRIETRHQ